MPAIRSRTTCWAPKPSAAPSTAADATRLATGTPRRSRTCTPVTDQMTAMTTQVRTWATACRCLAASERTRASPSVEAASIPSVMRRPDQVTKRASSSAPRTSSTISRPLLRSQVLMSVSGAIAGLPSSLHGEPGRAVRSSPATRTERTPQEATTLPTASPLSLGMAGGSSDTILPGDDLQAVPVGALTGRLADRRGPTAGVGYPAGVDGDRCRPYRPR